jgi:hypothetical protein
VPLANRSDRERFRAARCMGLKGGNLYPSFAKNCLNIGNVRGAARGVLARDRIVDERDTAHGRFLPSFYIPENGRMP